MQFFSGASAAEPSFGLLLYSFSLLSVGILAQGYATQFTLGDLREHFRLVPKLEQSVVEVLRLTFLNQRHIILAIIIEFGKILVFSNSLEPDKHTIGLSYFLIKGFFGYNLLVVFDVTLEL